MDDASDASQSNVEQIRYWNETAGPKWVSLSDVIDAQIASLGETVMDRLEVAEGDQVLDVGCGCGQSTLELARRVGASGRVTGLDVSRVMLDDARRRAVEAGLDNACFEHGDAQTTEPGAERFDVVFSRFGVMFFADPPAAFANLYRATRPGGRLGFVCWRAVEENPWMLVPVMAVAGVIPLPPRPEPGAPGPFALADGARCRALLEAAGFTAVEVEPLDMTMTLGGGGTLDEAVSFVMKMGPAGAALREAGEAAEEKATVAVREALTPYVSADGVRLDGAAWIVTARRLKERSGA